MTIMTGLKRENLREELRSHVFIEKCGPSAMSSSTGSRSFYFLLRLVHPLRPYWRKYKVTRKKSQAVNKYLGPWLTGVKKKNDGRRINGEKPHAVEKMIKPCEN